MVPHDLDSIAEITCRCMEAAERQGAILQDDTADSFPDAVSLLTQFLTSDHGRNVQAAVLETLESLADSASAALLYELWCRTRHPRLTALLTEGGWIPDFPAHLRVFSALESGNIEQIVDAGPETVRALVKATEVFHGDVRTRAVHCLERITNPDTIDALCVSWVETGSELLGRLIQERKYVARKPPAAMVLSALAAQEPRLILEKGAEVVAPLLAAGRDHDSPLSTRAKACLINLSNQDAIDALALIWAHERSAELDKIMLAGRYLAGKPPLVRVLSALKTNRWTEIADDGPALVHALFLALDDADPSISEPAAMAVEDLLERSEFQDAICRVVIEQGLPRAQEIAVCKGFRPVDVRYRALFYFLTEQWHEYENLDFDMSMLMDVYEHGGRDLRSRIAKRARQSGRLELVELVAGVRHRRRMGEMTVREWEATLAITNDRRDWETMWRLAQSAPPVWSVQALMRLDEVGWRPQPEDDLRGFELLLDLARGCTSEAPILGVADRPTAQFKAHGRRVSRLTISSYFQSTLASTSWDGTVRMWAMPEGTLVKALSGHRHPITGLAATADGSLIASGCGAEPNVILWTMPEGASSRSLPGHGKGVACLAMSPDGRLLAAGCHDGGCRLWRLRDAALLELLQVNREPVRCVAFSPDGRILATGGEDAAIRLWSVPDGRLLNSLKEHDLTVRSLVFSPDGDTLVSGGSDEKIMLWNLVDPAPVRVLAGHTNVVSALAVSGDGRVLASASWDKSVRLWIMPQGKPWGTLEEHTGPVTCLTTDPESRVLVSGSHDCRIMMWNFQSGVFRRPTTRKDMDRIENMAETPADDGEQKWLNYLLAQMRWRWRYDIEIDGTHSRIQVGEYDIEVDG